jgi:hypothetical protein
MNGPDADATAGATAGATAMTAAGIAIIAMRPRL